MHSRAVVSAVLVAPLLSGCTSVSEAEHAALIERCERTHDALLDALEIQRELRDDLKARKALTLGQPPVVPVILGVPSSRIDTAVSAVHASNGTVVATIPLGSADGVEIGWILTVARDGMFLGRLRIVTLGSESAIGIIEHAQSSIEIGDRVVGVPR
jgi:hypothetical protein